MSLLSAYLFPSKTSDLFKHVSKSLFLEPFLDSLRKQKPETLIFIGHDAGVYPDGLAFYAPKEGIYTFEDGNSDASDVFSFPFDQELAAQIQKSFHGYERKSYVHDVEVLPIDLKLLLSEVVETCSSVSRIVVLGFSLMSAQQHYDYGSLIGRALHSDSESSCIIARGQLSHCLSNDSPHGVIDGTKEFDESFIQLLKNRNWQHFLQMDPFAVEEAYETLYKSTCLCLGAFDALQKEAHFSELLYQEIEGVGFCSGELRTVPQ